MRFFAALRMTTGACHSERSEESRRTPSYGPLDVNTIQELHGACYNPRITFEEKSCDDR